MRWTFFRKINPVSLFLFLTLAPLVLVGSLLVISNAFHLKRERLEQLTETATQIRYEVFQKVESWESMVRLVGTTSDLFSAESARREKLIQQLLYQFPELNLIELYSQEGSLLAQQIRPGIYHRESFDLSDERNRQLMRAQEFWRGPIQSSLGNYPSLPMVIYSKSQGGFLYCEFSLKTLSHLLAASNLKIEISEGSQKVALSGGLMSFFQDPSAHSNRNIFYEAMIPELGWNIHIVEPWVQSYRQSIFLFLEILGGIFLVGLITSYLGFRVAKRAKQEIAHEERLAMIGTMASVIGHEIRTTLAVIKNSLSFVRQQNEEMDSKSIRHLDNIESQIKASDKVLGDILGFSQSRALKAKPASLNLIVEDLLSGFPIPARIQLEKKFSNNLPFVLADVDDVKRMISNIILNSLEAMEENGHLIIETQALGDAICLSITDTGTGIEKSDQKKIWDPFFTTKARGTGLGLAIVKKIMDRHEGQLKISSAKGQGTTVEMLFRAETQIQTNLVTSSQKVLAS